MGEEVGDGARVAVGAASSVAVSPFPPQAAATIRAKSPTTGRIQNHRLMTYPLTTQPTRRRLCARAGRLSTRRSQKTPLIPKRATLYIIRDSQKGFLGVF